MVEFGTIVAVNQKKDMVELVYKDNKIVQFGENDFTAFVFADEDCESIIQKDFTTLQDAKDWINTKIS